MSAFAHAGRRGHIDGIPLFALVGESLNLQPFLPDNMADLSKLADELSSLTVLEAADLARRLDEKWRSSAGGGYIFELDAELADTPFVDWFGTETVEFTLGYDVDREIVVLMSVMLVPGASYLDDQLDGVFDLRFGIREGGMKHEWNVTAPDYTRECANKYIPRQHRKAVFSVLCEALKLLTKHSHAKHLTMETVYTKVPDKALKKYEEICNFLGGVGFKLEDAFYDDDNGKNYWLLSSVPIETGP